MLGDEWRQFPLPCETVGGCRQSGSGKPLWLLSYGNTEGTHRLKFRNTCYYPPRPHPQTTMSSVIMIFHYGNRHMPVWQMSPTLVSVLVCFLRVTGLSYSCVAHIQSVPLAQGTGRQHLQAARGCNVCGGGHRLWSTDPDTNPRMTKETLHSPVVSLKRGKRVVRDIQYVKVKKNRICGNKGSFRAHLLSCDTN